MSEIRPYLARLGVFALYLLAVVLTGLLAGLVQRWTGQPIQLPPPPLPHEHEHEHADPYEPINYEGARYHGDHDQEHDHGHEAPHVEAGGRPFPQRQIRYWIDYPSAAQLRPALSAEAVSGSIRQAWGWWAESLDIDPAEVQDKAAAHLVISFNRRVFDTQDGPLGVLAACELGDGTIRQKRLIFDAAERWTAGGPAANQLSLPTVGCHEIGHWLGLGHDDPTAPAVMRPAYSSGIPRETTRDVGRAVAIGYAKRAAVPPPSAGDVLTFPVTARAGDLVDAIRKAGYTVKPPD